MPATAIVKGSLEALARDSKTSIAESFLSADVVIVVDVSGSMADTDDTASWDEGIIRGRSRYDRACDELAKLQATLPGKVAVVAFSSSPLFCPGGKPTFLRGSTDLAEALKFVRVADDTGMRFIVISDGQPNSEEDALREAKRFVSRIDCIYIGPEGERGADFLRRLSDASGGQFGTNHSAVGLSDGVQKLLTAGA